MYLFKQYPDSVSSQAIPFYGAQSYTKSKKGLLKPEKIKLFKHTEVSSRHVCSPALRLTDNSFLSVNKLVRNIAGVSGGTEGVIGRDRFVVHPGALHAGFTACCR